RPCRSCGVLLLPLRRVVAEKSTDGTLRRRRPGYLRATDAAKASARHPQCNAGRGFASVARIASANAPLVPLNSPYCPPPIAYAVSECCERSRPATSSSSLTRSPTTASTILRITHVRTTASTIVDPTATACVQS